MWSAQKAGTCGGVVAVLAPALVLLCGPSVAPGALAKPSAAYVACIELTGSPETSRDLKLRQSSCSKNERMIAWPPSAPLTPPGGGPVGPVGPAGATGPPGPT